MVASMARAVMRRQGFAALSPPPIHSSPTMALNVNECGTVSSHIFYQLFTHPPPAFFCPDLLPCKQTSLSLCLRSSAVAVISSPAHSLLPGKSCF